jgi:hypothetical protein
MDDCGKRSNGTQQRRREAGFPMATRRMNFLLINKDLFCISEGSRCWQEKKKEFVWDIAINNPQFFPQERTFAARIIFGAALTIRRFGE